MLGCVKEDEARGLYAEPTRERVVGRRERERGLTDSITVCGFTRGSILIWHFFLVFFFFFWILTRVKSKKDVDIDRGRTTAIQNGPNANPRMYGHVVVRFGELMHERAVVRSVESGEGGGVDGYVYNRVWDSPWSYVHGEDTGLGHGFSPNLTRDEKIGG